MIGTLAVDGWAVSSDLKAPYKSVIIRSTSKSRPNNIEGRNVRPPVRTSVRPSVRPYVRPSVRPSVYKKFLQFE